MTVSADGKRLIQANDRSFRDDFDRFLPPASSNAS
jgi:hypothetical protein